MDNRILWTLLLSALVLHSSLAYPHPKEDSQSQSQSDEDDTQQQQQQNIDKESLEEFTKKITQTQCVKGKPCNKKVEKLEDAAVEDVDDPCLEHKKVGPCKAAVPRVYFNKVDGKCENFIYGGCGGSRNNFKELAECETTCSKHLIKATILPVPQSEEEICDQPAVSGGVQCNAYMPRWTYNVTEEKCVQFIYGGCGKTRNNFANKYICESTCGGYKTSEPSEMSPTVMTPLSVPTSSPKDICSMPMDRGFCYAIKYKYYFDKQNNRCTKFDYGGCGGNENRFNTPEECVRACGGDSPAEDPECSNVDCPWGLYTHYTSLDCKPLYDGKSCCPTRFDCPDKPQPNNSIEVGRSLAAPIEPIQPKCFYKGKSYAIGENVQEASDTASCRAACICTQGPTEGPRIMCASIECPENLGAIPPGKAGCIPLYKRGSCCAYDFFCPNDTLTIIEQQEQGNDDESQHPENFKCNLDGVSYFEGQRFYPKKAKCLRCICQKGFNETLSEEFCENIDCGIEIYYSQYLAKGCAPVYFQSADGTSSCCPISWECPENRLNTPTPPSHSLTSSPTPAPVGPVPVTLGTAPPTLAVEMVPHNDNRTKHRVTQEACQLPKEVGNCKGSRRRYFHNTDTNQCEEFFFTGCGGNENNFVMLADCERLCINSDADSNRALLRSLDSNQQQPRSIYVTEVDPCTMPKKQGNCKGYFPRFFYSPESNSCSLFIFGGCRGNKNNFYSQESCEATCTNTIPEESLRSSIPSSTSQQSGGDASMVKFAEGGTMDVDPCSLPKLTGKCRAYVRRYHYDSESKQCKEFVYGGCSGNGNNFMSVRDCEKRCIVRDGDRTRYSVQVQPTEGNSQTSQDNNIMGLRSAPIGFLERCRLPMKSGSCLAIIPSYFYDVETDNCKFFLYSGCFGNANRFNTLNECEGQCKKPATTTNESEGIGGRMSNTPWRRTGTAPAAETHESETTRPQVQPIRPGTVPSNQSNEQNDKEMCTLAPSKGPCKAHELRFHYDSVSQQCLPFIYSGCRGNKNNFLSESDCLSVCGNQPTIEQLTSEGVLSCRFGNETLPLGATVGGKSRHSQEDIPCGIPICQCITPPSVTCVETSCPPPPPPPTPMAKVCAMVILTCESNCKEAVGEDGCPMCDCEDDDIETQVQVQEVFAKSVKG